MDPKRMTAAAAGTRPMCLRTEPRRYLDDDCLVKAGEYLCPGFVEQCSGGERYCLQTAETEAGAAVFDALAFAHKQFRAQHPDEIVVWLINEGGSTGPRALLPESTIDQNRRPAIYLNGTGPMQLGYQAAHEVFHMIWTPVTVHHWTHEVAAVAFALSYLQFAGRSRQRFREYRARCIEEATEGAKAFELGDLMRAEQPYPDAFYDRAILFGLQLIEIVGPAACYGLAKPGPAGDPDFWHWVDTLPTQMRRRIEAIAPPRTEPRGLRSQPRSQ